MSEIVFFLVHFFIVSKYDYTFYCTMYISSYISNVFMSFLHNSFRRCANKCTQQKRPCIVLRLPTVVSVLF